MFLYGNNSYTTIQGSGKGKLLVIKDSYANCLVPYLAQHYAQIGVIDPRGYGPVSYTHLFIMKYKIKPKRKGGAT